VDFAHKTTGFLFWHQFSHDKKVDESIEQNSAGFNNEEKQSRREYEFWQIIFMKD